MTLDPFSPRAARELEAAAERIAEDRPAAAEAFLQTALKAAARVVARPHLGIVRPYLPPRYRFWPLKRYSYLLVHDTMAEPVLILRVVHMRRDLPRVLAHLRD